MRQEPYNVSSLSKVGIEEQRGRSVAIATEETVRNVDEMIRTHRRVAIDRIGTIIGFLHSIAYTRLHRC